MNTKKIFILSILALFAFITLSGVAYLIFSYKCKKGNEIKNGLKTNETNSPNKDQANQSEVALTPTQAEPPTAEPPTQAEPPTESTQAEPPAAPQGPPQGGPPAPSTVTTEQNIDSKSNSILGKKGYSKEYLDSHKKKFDQLRNKWEQRQHRSQ